MCWRHYLSQQLLLHAEQQNLLPTSIAGGLKETKKQQVAAKRWKNFSIPKILFEDKAPQSQGSKIYHALIPNPTAYINKVAREVLNTLYYSEKDSIPAFNVLHYT